MKSIGLKGLAVVCYAIGLVYAVDSEGCYSSVLIAENKGSKQYASSSTCGDQCQEYAWFALKNGDECYCLKLKPSDSTSSSSCNVECNGYGDEMCGGKNVYSLYEGVGSEGLGSSDSSSLSSSSSPSSSSSSSSTSSSLSSEESSTTSESSSSSETATQTTVVTQLSSQGGKVVYKTETMSPSATTTPSSSSTSSSSSKSNKKDSGTNVGAIVGGVVGGVGGAILLGVLAFFFIRHRNSHEESEDEEEFYDKPSGLSSVGGTSRSRSKKTLSPLDMPMSNPFTDPTDTAAAGGGNNAGLVDPRLNPIMMGRRRLSDGSLADETDYSRKVLQVANPDD